MLNIQVECNAPNYVVHHDHFDMSSMGINFTFYSNPILLMWCDSCVEATKVAAINLESIKPDHWFWCICLQQPLFCYCMKLSLPELQA